MRPDEHAAAKALDFFALRIEMVDGVRFCAETTRRRSGRASVRGPDRHAVAIDGDAVRSAPRPSLEIQLRPVPDHAVGIGAAVDRWNVVGLDRAPALLRVHAGDAQREADDDEHSNADSHSSEY